MNILNIGTPYKNLMLLNFTCSNFRSFRSEVTMSMLPGATKNHPGHIVNLDGLEVLSTSAIFGANASGKSNIFKAMKYSHDLILGKKINENCFFRLDPEYKQKPSLFQYEFSIDDKLYRYGFEIIISERKIVNEWLWRVSASGEDTLIYQKPLDSNPGPASLIKLKRRLNKYLALTLMDELRNHRDPEIQEIITVRNWFKNNLKIISTDENLLSELDYTEEQCIELGKFLGDFDVGIFSVGFENVKIKAKSNLAYFNNELNIYDEYVSKNSPKKNKKASSGDKQQDSSLPLVLVNNHGLKDELFLWFDESDGTRRLMDLAPMIISNSSDITYIVDELDRSLHPMVVYEFVRRFTLAAAHSRKQLIFTTHQTCLLDQNLLRRDEIWFVQKERDGHSELYSLDQYNERSNKNIERMYLNGDFEAIPNILRGWSL